jgi:hypothetical protein
VSPYPFELAIDTGLGKERSDLNVLLAVKKDRTLAILLDFLGDRVSPFWEGEGARIVSVSLSSSPSSSETMSLNEVQLSISPSPYASRLPLFRRTLGEGKLEPEAPVAGARLIADGRRSMLRCEVPVVLEVEL